jgi:hypothetical protein
MRAGIQHDISFAQTDHLRQAQSGLTCHQHPGVIATSDPGTCVRGRAQRIDFHASEKTDQLTSMAFGRNCQDLLNACGVRWRLLGRVTKERTDGAQSQISAACAEAAAILQIIEVSFNQCDIHVCERQIGRTLLQALLCKL